MEPERVPTTAATTPQQPPSKKTPEDFRFGKLIGEGSFSSVYLAKEVKTGEEFAIKVCNKSHIIRERKTELIKREKDVMAILSAHRNPTAPFFVRLYATFQDVERLYFVMTYGHGGELLKYLHKVGSFDIPSCRFYAGELILGLAHLHKLKIVHRDLKPENILLDHRGHILITDFGSAKILTTTEQQLVEEGGGVTDAGDSSSPKKRGIRSNSFVGSAPYVSPEVLQGNYSIVGPPADLWAYGCILYQFVSGLPPFHGASEYLIFQKIIKLDYQFPPGFDPDAQDLVQKLLRPDNLDRLGARDSDHRYSSVQSHSFFQELNFDTLHTLEAPLPSFTKSANPDGGGGTPKSQVPDTIEPGYNERLIAERTLREDDEDFMNLSWRDGTGGKNPIDSDEDEDEEEESVCLSSLLATDKPDTSPTESERKSSNPEKTLRRNFLPANEAERQERLGEQVRNNPWNASVKGNLILKQGLISKKKGLFSRRRMLLLTEGPHLYYCEPNKKTVKGEIPWSRSLVMEAKDFRIFYAHTPNRTYYLEDPEGYALEWCKAINEVRHQTYGDLPKTRNLN